MAEDLITRLYTTAPALAALAMVVLVLVVGTTTQILADRLRIPATGPLLLAGLILGPALLGLVQPNVLGEGLRVIIRAAVAVVVFEGGLLLDVGELRRTPRAVVGLVTVGLLITTGLSALFSRLLLGWSWELSLLFGAIISVTGPTVIGPILQKVRVNPRVRITLESESIIADPLGVILAALIFTAITHPLGWKHAGPHALVTFAAGAGVGAGVAAFVWLTADRFRLLPAKFARLTILGAALTAYTVAELASSDAGVLAAAVAGIVIGSLEIPHKEQVEQFKGDLASLAISAVFILLAASLQPADLAGIGWRGVAIVALVMLVVRPVRVFLSTWGSELHANEKLFISFLGPRGVVAASVATFFSLRLTDTGHVRGHEIVAMVFAVVLGTVLIEGSAAGWLARRLKVMPQSTIVIGADEVGRHLARDLNESGEAVTLIDNDPDACHRASRVSGVRILCEDAASLGVLKRAGAEDARCLIAATRSDKVNLMVCELTKAVFHIPRLVARVNQEENAAAFEEAGIETVSPARATASGLHNLVLRPSLFRLLSDRGGTGHVAEVVVASKQAIGRTLADLALSGCGVVAVRRGDTVLVPRGALRLAAGDVVTLLGDQNAVTSASERLGSVEKPEG